MMLWCTQPCASLPARGKTKSMKRGKGITLALVLCTSGISILVAASGAAAPPHGPVADAPNVTSVKMLLEKELHWGISHQEVTDAYNNPGGYFDKEYAPQIGKLQPGVVMQQLEADRDSRKTSFMRAFAEFLDTPTGYDLTPIHMEYTYRNEEAVQPLFKDGKKRYFFYIKDKLWKVYDEVPLKANGPLGASYTEAVTKLNALLAVAGRTRQADPTTHDPDITTTDWQDGTTHLRAVDRSGEHLIGIVLEDRATLGSLASLRKNKPVTFGDIDPSISAVTKGGISDPNAARSKDKPDAGAAKHR
jgi:hypothetical protein